MHVLHLLTDYRWCTEKLIKAKGLISVNIPEDLAGGYYLVRPEILSLHEADKTPAQPQFYAGCAQIFLESSATGKPSNTVSIPGYVKAGDPGMTFNIYTPDPFPYPMYGPEVYKSSTSNSRHRVKPRSSYTTQNEGILPANCVVENGNWCGIELESYSTDAACWAQSKICWEQSDVCYGTAAPTGYQGCTAWENKCHANDDACNAGNHIGPLNKGKILTPKITAVYDLKSAFGEEGAQNAVPAGPDGSAPFVSLPVADAPVETSAGPAYEEPAAPTSTTSPATTPVVIDYEPDSHTPTPTLANPESVPSVASSVTFAAAISSSSPGSIDDESTVIITTLHTVTVTKNCAEAQYSRRAEVPADFSLILDGPTPSVLVPSGVSISLVSPSSSTSFPAMSSPAFTFINSNSSSGAPGDFFRLLPTIDGSCGGATGFSCLGREEDGGCCSKYGWCGYTDEYCGEGCQEGFGKCGNATVGARPPRRAVVKRQEASTVTHLFTLPCTKTSKTATQTLSASSTPRPADPHAMFYSGSSSANTAEPDVSLCGAGASSKSCTAANPGYCCSKYGFCGNSADHCGLGCQPLFGHCGSSAKRAEAQKLEAARLWPREVVTVSVTAAYCGDATSTTTSTKRSTSTKTVIVTEDAAVGSATKVTKTNTNTKTVVITEATVKTLPINTSPVTAFSITTAAANAAAGALKVSVDNKCGGSTGQTCAGRPEGHCCSEFGYCGNADGHCGKGCQMGFGVCGAEGPGVKARRRAGHLRRHVRW